ncbi:MAG: DUF262 domain-containing protein [Candidatus Binataceae bacterium]
MANRTSTTKDVALLYQLFSDGQLKLAAEFQRNSVWPRPAKAYLIDTILNDRPIPLLYFQRTRSAQTGRPSYAVIDGQQRLRAIFDFLDNRVRLTQSPKRSVYFNKRFEDLPSDLQDRIRNYDLIVQELTGYADDDIRDMFIRINKYVVQLSPQEMRHAKGQGRFHDFVEKLGTWDRWKTHRIFSPKQRARMRPVEFSAELVILLIEGPQDKKASVDLYYGRYRDKFSEASQVESRLKNYFEWIERALPNLSSTRYRKPVDLYSLVGALDRMAEQGARLSKVDAEGAGSRLLEFDKRTRMKTASGDASRYLAAASRQTDNLTPRTTRIDILEHLLRG